ncbi:F-box protein At4g00755 isoform X1 [Coffea arabica]|uniref:F-box protein At4g00755-like isoform X1 n=2 Tax=Coffea arabica TaxID=13443 RepID=A0A6P6W8H0_COFAR|nr:F-box protein At4g00755-like isoform X1 [Coffea arabica]XP_027110382.1 F-box protein At4g00755-like isoform X1 [Coffea arabica]XP_027110384.1 F-box protein At4g00755-like isoform X1 [Coffea arabica]
MEVSNDFIEWLGADLSVKILMFLEDPSDLVRVSAVSSSWRQFMIVNGICKKLCLKMFPEMSTLSRAIEISNMIEPVESRTNEPIEWACLKRDHKVYAFLAQGLASFPRKDCLSEALGASSTDNYADESIQNTLEPSDRIGQRASYWSSKGEIDSAIAETLTYKLRAKLCVITEIHIQPFQAYFQFGSPIYSAKAVRFLMGHSIAGMEAQKEGDVSSAAQESSHEKFVWTYVSPEFPMAHENCLQKFMLPEPVLCIGGILQVQLLGRVKKQEIDSLYYICVSHVEVVGRPATPAFDVEILDQSGKCMLRHNPEQHLCSNNRSPQSESSCPPRIHRFSASIRGWEHMILNTLLGARGIMVNDYDYDGEDDDSDDQYN